MNSHKDPDLAQRLILHAARKAPAALSERLEEEWLADLASRTGSLARLRLALGCCWAMGVITRDFRVPQLATSGGSAVHRPLLGELGFNLPLLSRRTVTFIVIAGLHGLLIYGFASGFAQHVIQSFPIVTQGEVIVETHTPPPAPDLKHDIRLATFDIPETVDPVLPPIDDGKKDDGQIALIDNGPPGITNPSPVVPSVTRVVGGPGKGFPASADFYPDASRRMSETGAADVQVCVNTQGRLTGDPVIAKSSGSRRIDAAALTLARAGTGHYRPSTENGEPVSSCYPYRIRFELTN
jgi:TonB family protein